MDFLKTVAAGGQTWAHRVRMLRQVLRIIFGISITLGALFFALRAANIPKTLWQGSYYYFKGQIAGVFNETVSVNSQLWAKVSGLHYPSAIVEVDKSALTRSCLPYLSKLQSCLTRLALQSGIVASIAFSIFIVFFLTRGLLARKKKHISGQELIPSWKLILKRYLKRNRSPIKLGSLPLVKGTETQHLLISGGTGSGKTNLFHHVLPQLRALGQKAVIVDTTGDFVAKYYREGKDILLNPFDARSAPWHPWCECHDVTDYDSMAHSFIPHSNCEKDDYWRGAARSVFSASLRRFHKSQKTSLLKQLLLYEPLGVLHQSLQKSKAASHLDPSSDKTAGSIRSVATSFLECLDFLRDTTEPFSIRDWVQKEDNDDSWLFLSTTVGQRASLTPLISAWFSVAMRSLIQMDIDIHRRLWLVADELPSLQRLRDLETCLTESRKFGGCALLAVQSPAQLEGIYGAQSSKVIIGNCSTRVAFFDQDPEIASRISKTFGEREVCEFQEGISYGAHQMRDGVSLSSQNRSRPVVSTSDIQSLNKHEAYVKLPGKTPITKIKLKFKNMPKIAEPFVRGKACSKD